MAIAICQATQCAGALYSWGGWLLLAVPWLVLAATIVISVVLIRRRRRAFYVPLIGIVVALVATASVDQLLS